MKLRAIETTDKVIIFYRISGKDESETLGLLKSMRFSSFDFIFTSGKYIQKLLLRIKDFTKKKYTHTSHTFFKSEYCP